MITGAILIRALIGGFIMAAIVISAFRSSKPYMADPFGDYPSMTPLDVEWISKHRKRSCDCEREPRGA